VSRLGQAINDVCPEGHYCPIGSGAPFPCPAGTYSFASHLTQVSQCLNCTAGFYCNSTGIIKVTQRCIQGYYCPPGTAIPSRLCPTGHFCVAGTSVPPVCPAGTYQDTQGQFSCKTCPAGYYCNPGSSTYLGYNCPQGFYCTSGTQSPKQYPCPIGTFNNVTNLRTNRSCTSCSPGYFCNATGLSKPSGKCQKGYFCGSGSSTATPDSYTVNYLGNGCVQRSSTSANDVCPQGHYCPEGSAAPIPCPAGKMSNSLLNSNVSQCINCTAGFSCNAGTAVAVVACSAGFYCPSGTASPRLLCPAGSYCPAGCTRPRACAAGMYQNNTGQAACVQCPKGFFCVSGTSQPVICPPGYYCLTGTTFSKQYPCPVGTFSNRSHLVNVTGCFGCSPGYFCNQTGLTAPAGLCTSGYYCGGSSSTPVPDARTTYYLGNTCFNRQNPALNDVCPPGHYCSKGSSSPTACPPGTYSNSTQRNSVSQCNSCNPGYYCDLSGQTRSWKLCTAGFFCPGGDSVPTHNCTLGHYCTAGVAQPIPCPVGTYQDQVGQVQCKTCVAGFYCATGVVRPTPCPQGYYCPAGTQSSNQYPCPIGTFNNLTNLRTSSQCALCTPGYFCNATGLTVPKGQCSAGFYCGNGSKTATPDAYYQTYTGDTCVPRTGSHT